MSASCTPSFHPVVTWSSHPIVHPFLKAHTSLHLWRTLITLPICLTWAPCTFLALYWLHIPFVCPCWAYLQKSWKRPSRTLSHMIFPPEWINSNTWESTKATTKLLRQKLVKSPTFEDTRCDIASNPSVLPESPQVALLITRQIPTIKQSHPWPWMYPEDLLLASTVPWKGPTTKRPPCNVTQCSYDEVHFCQTQSRTSVAMTHPSLHPNPFQRTTKSVFLILTWHLPPFWKQRTSITKVHLKCPFGYKVDNRTGGCGCFPTWRCSCPGHPQISLHPWVWPYMLVRVWWCQWSYHKLAGVLPPITEPCLIPAEIPFPSGGSCWIQTTCNWYLLWLLINNRTSQGLRTPLLPFFQ